MTPAAHWSPADGMAAIDRARQAWERSQPQLFLELDGLEQTDAGTTEECLGGVGLLERAPAPRHSPSTGTGALDTPTGGTP